MWGEGVATWGRNEPRGGGAEEVRHDVMFKLHHALACTINCVLLAITQAYKYSWLLKPLKRFTF